MSEATVDDADDEGMVSKPLGGLNDALDLVGCCCGASGLFYCLSTSCNNAADVR